MGTRITTQKLKILEYLKSVKTHPTAETIYEAIKKDLPAISLATVYRNLNRLADESIILRFKAGNEFRFDADICHHQHCICKKCGKIIDVFQKEISEYAIKNFKSDQFKPCCVGIIFSGICNKCN